MGDPRAQLQVTPCKVDPHQPQAAQHRPVFPARPKVRSTALLCPGLGLVQADLYRTIPPTKQGWLPFPKSEKAMTKHISSYFMFVCRQLKNSVRDRCYHTQGQIFFLFSQKNVFGVNRKDCALKTWTVLWKKPANVRAKTYLLEQTRKVKPNWLKKSNKTPKCSEKFHSKDENSKLKLINFLFHQPVCSKVKKFD